MASRCSWACRSARPTATRAEFRDIGCGRRGLCPGVRGRWSPSTRIARCVPRALRDVFHAHCAMSSTRVARCVPRALRDDEPGVLGARPRDRGDRLNRAVCDADQHQPAVIMIGESGDPGFLVWPPTRHLAHWYLYSKALFSGIWPPCVLLRLSVQRPRPANRAMASAHRRRAQPAGQTAANILENRP